MGNFSRSRSKPKGRGLDPLNATSELESLTAEQVEEKARNILLNRLSRGPRSKQQLRELLVAREIPEEIRELLLERFEDVGLIDDKKFAEIFARDRRNSRGLAIRSVAQKLREVGVSQEDAQQALEQFEDGSDLELATELLQRRWNSLRVLDWETRRRRVFGYLGRRGFGSSTIAAALQSVERADESNTP